MLPQRKLGRSPFTVSEIGFGAWAIGSAWGATVPQAEAEAALHRAIDLGVNFIDTADVYGDGRSESIIGTVLKKRSERVIVATKMGRSPGWTPDYASMEQAARLACERLQVENLDLIQLHCIPFSVLQQGDVFTHLEKLQEKGLIKAYGASVESVEEGLHCIENSNCVSLQVIFNIFRQKLITDLFPKAESSSTGIIVRLPLSSGVLTGKFAKDHQFHPEDHRSFNANGEQFNVGETFSGIPFADSLELVEELKSLLPLTESQSLLDLSLRWILDHPAVSTIIPGAKNPKQAEQNLKASSLPPLSPEVHQKLNAFYSQKVAQKIRGPY